MTRKIPVIGVTLDSEEGGGYSPLPWYALRKNYVEAVAAHGAAPVLLPHHPEAAEHYLSLIDGLIVTGGAFDIDPAMYGESTVHATVTTKKERTAFEFAIIRGAIERKIPVLGICGGEQLMNVVLGGTLVQHVPEVYGDAIGHEQKNPRTEPSHSVAIVKDTLLHRITGRAEMQVNSSHHQAVAKPAPGCIVNATAPDGVIEGIEYTDHPFCLGVEWHPEYGVTEGDVAIHAALVAACRDRAHGR